MILSNQEIKNSYQSNVSRLNKDLKRVRKSISYLYLARLITFVGFIVFLILFFHSGKSFLYLFLSVFSLISFFMVVKLDLTAARKETFLSNKLQINKDELQYLEHQYTDKDAGADYFDLNPHLTADFELFGTGSLFQYLNRCVTILGKNKLAANICKTELNQQVILDKQEGISELSGKTDFMHDFRAHGRSLTEDGDEWKNLQTWLNEKQEKTRSLKAMAIFFPLLNFSWLIMIGSGLLPGSTFILPVLLSLSVAWRNNGKISQAHQKLGKTAKTFNKYSTLIRLIEDESFHSVWLQKLRNQLLGQANQTGNDGKQETADDSSQAGKDGQTGDNGHRLKKNNERERVDTGRKWKTKNHRNLSDASDALRKLFTLLNGFDMRYNMLVSFILNSLILIDIQVYLRLIRWKETHKTQVGKWFDALTGMDALISFSTYAFNNQTKTTYPKVSKHEEYTLEGKALGHPLIPPGERVSNDFTVTGQPKVIIITGANMAGKSTFLRTVAVNLIMAMNGAPVCATDLTFTPCDIMSSIKIQDSLYQHESYFYAELLRIRDIIDHVKVNRDTLVIFDEILRGTNTKDKQLGSLGILEKLMRHDGIVLVATHDLSIGNLEQKYPETVENYCFEVELHQEQLKFDYQLKKGISQKLNASFLMKKMDII